ncbi:MAG TPA: Rrf2 family transcriptional regulator [Mycobacteriales bacterium]
MRIPAKADYAVRALVELAATAGDRPLPADRIAAAQEIAAPFLAGILGQLRLAGLVRSVRGAEGGFLLARPATEITLADVMRAVDGPLATLSGHYPETLSYPGPAAGLRDVWVAVRANLRAVLEHTTVADVAGGTGSAVVRQLVADQDAWQRR